MHGNYRTIFASTVVDGGGQACAKFKKIKKSSQTLLRFFVVPHRSRPPNAAGQITRLPEGRLAQLVERLVYTEDVGSSSLSSPTISQVHFRQIMVSEAGYLLSPGIART